MTGSYRSASKDLPANQLWFESEVFGRLAAEYPEIGPKLMEQYASATVVERWGSGIGFITDYTVDPCADRLTQTNFEDAYAVILSLEGIPIPGDKSEFGTAQCWLSVRDGYIFELNCTAIGDNWPTSEYILGASEA